MINRRQFLKLAAATAGLVAAPLPAKEYPPVEFILNPPFAGVADPLDWQGTYYGWMSTFNGKQYGDYLILGDDSPETLAAARRVLEWNFRETIDAIRAKG